MLLRVIVQNFLSFFEPVQFDMFPNMKKETFESHIYRNQQIPVLKQAALFGPNGSGKSNFVKAVNFIQSIATQKNFLEKINISKYFFRLTESNNQPISMAIEFCKDEQYFIYIIDILPTHIEKEELYLSGLGKEDNKLVFSRTKEGVSLSKMPEGTLLEAIKKMILSNPLSSLLVLNNEFPIIEDELAKTAFQWFNNDLEVVSINTTAPGLIDLMSRNEEILQFTNNIFSEIGIGINRVKVQSEPFEQWLAHTDDNNKSDLTKHLEQSLTKENEIITRMQHKKNLFTISIEDGIKTVKEFIFEQLGKNGYVGEMDILAQSDGTVRLLTLIPAIYDAISKGKTVVIDEIDNSIHPKLMYALIEYYSHAKTSGQLIYTTHEMSLLDQQNLLRPDEIWLTEKKDGATNMYSLNEFKLHNTISIEKGYREGRYGANPHIELLDK